MTGPQKFRKKPVVIEAIQLTDAVRWSDVAEWCGGRYIPEINRIVVPTLHGKAHATTGHWIAKGPRDFWPVDEKTFAETYEAVSDV